MATLTDVDDQLFQAIQADVAGLGWTSGSAFARALPELAGVVCIPTEVFCDGDVGRTLVRFAFCKQDHVLEEAVARLAKADLGSAAC